MEKKIRALLKIYIDKIINESLINSVFSGCSVGFLVRDAGGFIGDIHSYGFTGEDKSDLEANKKSIFDLASMTKPLVTSLSLLPLLEEGKVGLDDRLVRFFGSRAAGKEEISLFQLLTHSSGLPAHQPFYKELIKFPEKERKDTLIDMILAEELCYQPGTDNIYSDLGFMLLGNIIEIISGESLDCYWERKIITPLGLEKGLFFTNKRKIGTGVCVDTGKCGWSQNRLCGKVNDDNCRAVGGVAGHAGLFGSVDAVLSMCENLLLQFRDVRQHPAYSGATLRKVLDKKHGTWVFGFDTPSPGGSSSGRHFSAKSIGHLGFTGTSFWIDLQKEIAVVFLTNRVFYGDNLEPIKKLRPLLHDTIRENI
jgi:CubicO group peptidase (beta-lactamase class C family)